MKIEVEEINDLIEKNLKSIDKMKAPIKEQLLRTSSLIGLKMDIADMVESKKNSLHTDVKEKYRTHEVRGVKVQIEEVMDMVFMGFTKGLLEAYIPEMKGWTEKRKQLWITENNKRMEAICELLNKKGL